MDKTLFAIKTKEVELKSVAFLLSHSKKSIDWKSEWFQNKITKNIFDAIKYLVDNSLKVTLDEIYVLVKKKIPDYEFKDLASIPSLYDDYSNIKFLKNQLRDNYIKFVENKNILTEVSDIYTSGDDLEISKLEKIRDKLNNNIATLQSQDTFPTIKDTFSRYDKILEERKVGEIKRTLGYKALDDLVGNRVAKRGSMLTVFGESGSGKTNFTLSMVNALVNNPRRIPVAYFSLENSEEDTVDILMSMRTDFTTDQLEEAIFTDSELAKYERAKQLFLRQEHFVIFDEYELSVDILHSKIIQFKQYLAEKQLLPDDEYCVIVLDLATMIKDFGDLDARLLEQTINKLHRIVRKEKIFLINVVQANENDLRNNKKFSKPEDVQKYRLLRQNIKHGSAFFERSRCVIALMRKREIMKTYFPDDKDEWLDMPDLIEVQVLKNNRGKTGFMKFSFQPEPIRIVPFLEET